MNYTLESHIKSIEDVKTFFHCLMDEHKLNFHPDNDFADYISYEDKTPMFTSEEVMVINRMMDESYDVCEKKNVHIYNIGFNNLANLLKLIEKRFGNG